VLSEKSSATGPKLSIYRTFSSPLSLVEKMDPQTQNDIAKLSDADRKELTQFLENEAQRSNIQQSK
jgi:hypothetical protein